MTVRTWRKRVRLIGWAYFALLILAFFIFFYAASNASQRTSGDTVYRGKVFGGMDAFVVTNWSLAVLVVLFLIGSVAVIVVSFLKRHTVVAVVGTIAFVFMILSALAGMSENDPTGGMAFGMVFPFFLFGLGFPVVGAIRRAKPGSKWASGEV